MQPRLKNSKELPSGCLSKHIEGTCRATKGTKLCSLGGRRPRAFPSPFSTFGAGDKGGEASLQQGHGLCALNVLDPVNASVALVGERGRSRIPDPRKEFQNSVELPRFEKHLLN